MEQESSCGHRQEDQANGQEQNRAQICSEISPGGENGGRIDEGRKKQTEHQLRFQVNGGQAGNQSQNHTTDGQQDGVRDADSPGNDCQQSDDNETNQD